MRVKKERDMYREKKKRTFLFEGEDEWFLLLSLILSATDFFLMMKPKKFLGETETDFFL